MTKDIHKDTIRLLAKDRGQWADTARETGLGYEWIKKMAWGHIQEPGYKKLTELHSYLSEKYSKKKSAA